MILNMSFWIEEPLTTRCRVHSFEAWVVHRLALINPSLVYTRERDSTTRSDLQILIVSCRDKSSRTPQLENTNKIQGSHTSCMLMLEYCIDTTPKRGNLNDSNQLWSSLLRIRSIHPSEWILVRSLTFEKATMSSSYFLIPPSPISWSEALGTASLTNPETPPSYSSELLPGAHASFAEYITVYLWEHGGHNFCSGKSPAPIYVPWAGHNKHLINDAVYSLEDIQHEARCHIESKTGTS